MKTFKIRFSALSAIVDGFPTLIEPAFDIEVLGSTMSLVPTGGADYLQIKAGKGEVVFSCDASAILYCQALPSEAAKLTAISTEGVNGG